MQLIMTFRRLFKRRPGSDQAASFLTDEEPAATFTLLLRSTQITRSNAYGGIGLA